MGFKERTKSRIHSRDHSFTTMVKRKEKRRKKKKKKRKRKQRKEKKKKKKGKKGICWRFSSPLGRRRGEKRGKEAKEEST